MVCGAGGECRSGRLQFVRSQEFIVPPCCAQMSQESIAPPLRYAPIFQCSVNTMIKKERFFSVGIGTAIKKKSQIGRAHV